MSILPAVVSDRVATVPAAVSTPSLLEIQLEQAKQLAEEQSQQEQQAKVSN